MTVHELILKLKGLDPTHLVITNGKHEWNKCDYIKAKDVELLEITEDDNTYYEAEGNDSVNKIIGVIIT